MGANESKSPHGAGAASAPHNHLIDDKISAALFRKYDVSKTGTLSGHELKKLLKAEYGFDEEQIQLSGVLMDGNLDGKIDLKEMQRILKEQNLCKMICETESSKFLSEACKIFHNYDKDGSGTLNKKELYDLLISMGIPKNQCDKILSDADADKNALLNFSEFIHWLPATASLLKHYK